MMRRAPAESMRFGIAAVSLALALLIVQMALWAQLQIGLGLAGAAIQVGLFFLLEAVYLGVILLGAVHIRRWVVMKYDARNPSSVASILASALSSKTDLRRGVIAGAAYAILYAFISSILVYQPGVDFAAAYGISSPALATVACCGTLGTTPTIIVYVAPQLHVGLQLVPLDLLFLAVIPLLIVINSSTAFFAIRNMPRGKGGLWMGGVGAVVGLFTACPTCAGYFLASAFGGVGAAGIAVALAPFQIAFIAVSVPVLVVSPLLTAASLRKALLSACAVVS